MSPASRPPDDWGPNLVNMITQMLVKSLCRNDDDDSPALSQELRASLGEHLKFHVTSATGGVISPDEADAFIRSLHAVT